MSGLYIGRYVKLMYLDGVAWIMIAPCCGRSLRMLVLSVWDNFWLLLVWWKSLVGIVSLYREWELNVELMYIDELVWIMFVARCGRSLDVFVQLDNTEISKNSKWKCKSLKVRKQMKRMYPLKPRDQIEIIWNYPDNSSFEI